VVSETVLDFGARRPPSYRRAAYDEPVADYRRTALTAFQNVEDALAAARVQDEEAFDAVAANRGHVKRNDHPE
jgi:outer membrane protein TolC